MNSTDKLTLDQSSATSYNQNYCSPTFSDLSIGGSPSDINPVCVDAVLQMLDTDDRRWGVDRNKFFISKMIQKKKEGDGMLPFCMLIILQECHTF